jgi:tRNA (guanine-N(7)-)-methyltransferase subunit TRM82
MPKRPSALAIAQDGKTIIVGDKFGDVYSMPLLPKPEDDQSTPAPKVPTMPKSFAPTANETTVHSKANLKILESQRKQAERGEGGKTKQPLDFEHELLLGHVSMLTDLVIGSQVIDLKAREVLITADRDEHIRVSRGPPQAYVVEKFLLGHHEFISKLCVIPPWYLISGGGQDEVYVWNWWEGKILQRINLSPAVQKALGIENDESQNGATDSGQNAKIAVTGIWTVPFVDIGRTVLVACEGVPALLHFPLLNDLEPGVEAEVRIFKLKGNVLDAGVVGHKIFVSIDNVHEPGTTSTVEQTDVSDIHEK